MNHTPDQNVAVIGLGKLGIVLAAAIGARGFTVSGYDPNRARGELLVKGPLDAVDIAMERGLGSCLSTARANITVADSIKTAIEHADICFVVVPTPSLPNGGFDPAIAAAVLSEIGAALKNGPAREKPHLVVLVSTVSPGSTNDILLQTLEQSSASVSGEAFSFCYAPALVALGTVLDGFVSPDFAFVGQTDTDGGARLETFLSVVLKPGTPILRMSAQSAEIAKIGLNNFLTLKISFSNLIGQLCHSMPGADARDTLQAIGSDTRVGRRFLNAGMSYGGPCLPRDTHALGHALAQANLDCAIPAAAAALNQSHQDWLVKLIAPEPHETVCVYGLSYRAGSHITEESASIKLANALFATGAKTVAIDPNLKDMDLSELARGVLTRSDAISAIDGADILVLTAPLDQSDLSQMLERNEGVRVVDLIGTAGPEMPNAVRFGSAP